MAGYGGWWVVGEVEVCGGPSLPGGRPDRDSRDAEPRVLIVFGDKAGGAGGAPVNGADIDGGPTLGLLGQARVRQ